MSLSRSEVGGAKEVRYAGGMSTRQMKYVVVALRFTIHVKESGEGCM